MTNDVICKMRIQDWPIHSLLLHVRPLDPVSLKRFCHLIKLSRALTGSFGRLSSVPRTYLELILHWEKINYKSIFLPLTNLQNYL